MDRSGKTRRAIGSLAGDPRRFRNPDPMTGRRRGRSPSEGSLNPRTGQGRSQWSLTCCCET